MGLLGQSLRDMKVASRAMLLSGPDQVAAVSAAVSATDSRADEVSRMARWAEIGARSRAGMGVELRVAGDGAHTLR